MTARDKELPAMRARAAILRIALPLAAALLCGVAGARAAESTPEQARAALSKATAYLRSISTEGGYLWWYSEDLKQRRGEETATATQVWVQPPGTPSVGEAFLRAYRATKDSQYLRAARDAGLALARGQLQSGGWDYLIEFDPEQAKKWYRRTDAGRVPEAEAARRKKVSTFDDDNSQSALRFLMELVDTGGGGDEAETAETRRAMEYGLAKMLEAQYPNGAWPQRWDGKPRDPPRNSPCCPRGFRTRTRGSTRARTITDTTR